MDLTNNKQTKPATTYYEKKIGKTLYRITSEYKGEIDLTKALEDLIIRKMLRNENVSHSDCYGET